MADTPIEAAEQMIYVRFTFCDDVRQELYGKHSLMGVFGHVLGLPASPAVLPKLVALAQLSLPLSYAGQDLVLTTRDGANVLAAATLTLPSPVPPSEAPLSQAVDARLTSRLILTVPMEFIGFEARDGMCLTMSAQLGDKTFHSEPLTVVAVRPTDTH